MDCLTLRVDLFGDLEGVGIGEVCVGRRDGEDEAVLFADELQQHVPDLNLNVWRLITHWNLRHARQIDQRQIQDFQHLI